MTQAYWHKHKHKHKTPTCKPVRRKHKHLVLALVFMLASFQFTRTTQRRKHKHERRDDRTISILLCLWLCLHRCVVRVNWDDASICTSARKLKNSDKLSAYILVIHLLPFLPCWNQISHQKAARPRNCAKFLCFCACVCLCLSHV